MDDRTVHSGTGWCHIQTLPDELLSEIQSLATHVHDQDVMRYRFPSVLCRVSRWWSMVAYSTPEIWNLILINDENTLNHTQQRMAKTGNVLLDIKITDPAGDLNPDKVLEPLLPSSDRWALLNLHIKNMVPYATRLPRELPLLRELFFIDNGPEFVVSTSLPKLELMTLHVHWLCRDPSVFFGTQLIELRASGSEGVELSVGKLLGFLRNSPNLEILELKNSWLFEPLTSNETVQVLLALPAELPKLKALRLDPFYSWELVILLSCIRARGLRYLMISIEYCPDSMPSLLHLEAYHFNFPSLRKLTIRERRTTKHETMQILIKTQGIQALSLIAPTDDYSALESIMETPAFVKMASQLERIYLEGIPPGRLHATLSQLSSETNATSLLRRVTWVINSRDAGVSNAELADPNERNGFLGGLELMIPHLEVADEDVWWH